MSNDQQAIHRDLTILAAMVAEIDEYLMSEATHWTMAQGEMPKLTIGGCLMRRDRLLAVRDLISDENEGVLDTAVHQLADSMANNVVRYEQRMHQEGYARINEWGNYLGHMASRMVADVAYYASVVDTRTVITHLINQLQQRPYRLQPQILEQVTQLDHNLEGRWVVGPFVWPEVWREAYPPEEYWWLYGHPK